MTVRQVLSPAVVAMLVSTASCRESAPVSKTPSPDATIEDSVRKSQTEGEALDRKQRSIARLRLEGVPLIEHLPVIETVHESKRRSTEEVAQRAVALAIVAGRA